jgi:SAM-dependent methyltransferase
MPKLDASLHLDMLKDGKRSRSPAARVLKAVRVLIAKKDVYGLEWGDPEKSPPLAYIRDQFLVPYVGPGNTVAEIGPGGGRWTRYMLESEHIYAVDYHAELLSEVTRNFKSAPITPVKNNGDDFPGMTDESVDFLFSFGVFVHLNLDIIDRYLGNMKRVLKPGANVVLQYADKTKPMAQLNDGFSDNNPDKMRAMLAQHGYEIREEDEKTLWHSSVVRFGRAS